MDKTSEKERVNEMIDTIMKVARGDYSVQVELSGQNDEVDSLAMGLNMMIGDIRTSVEDLDRHAKELSVLNKHLQQEITERKRMEHDLQERVKELRCLYGIANIAERLHITSDELYQEVANLLPKSWQYPEITCARTIINNKKFETENYRETEWKLSSDVKVGGAQVGTVEVSYLEERPEIDEGPFMKEERLLIDAIAERLGRITERKRMEEEIKIKDRAIASSLSGIAITNMQANITYVNPSFLQMWGYDDDKEVLGTSGIEFWQLKEKADEALHTIQEKGTWFGELTATRKDGTSLDVQVSASTITGVAGEPIGIVASFVDITERKRMERELQKKNQQLDARNEELQSQAEELVAQQQELQEKNEQLDARNEELQSQAEELEAQQQELVEKTEEVERASRLKSEFLANMSHELRTPLNVIIGFSQLMMDGVSGKINAEQKQCLNDVLDSSQHLLNLINEVLDLSRIESGKMALRLENVALTEVIQSLSRTMRPILTPRKQSLDVEIEEGLPPVYADEARLGQMLLNLVHNAAKYTPDGGKLKIEAVSEGDWCRVSMIDNGIGIKEEDKERIFEPFCQLGNPLTKERNGVGLGLTLVKQIVERYGGRIWVESEYGKGSRFTFTVPLATDD